MKKYEDLAIVLSAIIIGSTGGLVVLVILKYLYGG